MLPHADPTCDTLGLGGVYRDPVWRVEVRLSPVERDLLGEWPLRRLAFFAHAGAAAITTVQTYSRLEHSLGVLALTAHFLPDDDLARVAALLHDVGHLPLSHTLEGLHGLDHHVLGAERVRALAPLLTAHGVDVDHLVAVVSGHQPSALSNDDGVLTLDHLDSFIRSAHARGYTAEPPPATLTRLRLTQGKVDTDMAAAGELARLVVDEARRHCSTANMLAVGAVRWLVERATGGWTTTQVAALAQLTDDELWTLLLTSPTTAAAATSLRRDPAAWQLHQTPPERGPSAPIAVRRLYVTQPLVDGAPAQNLLNPAALPKVPTHRHVNPPDGVDLDR